MPIRARIAWCSTSRANRDVQEIVYRIKATNVGQYTVPPAYGESMYDRGVRRAIRGRPNRGGAAVSRRLSDRVASLGAGIAGCSSRRLVTRALLAARAACRTRIPSSVAVLDSSGRLLRLTLASDQQYRLWTPLEQIPQEFVEALLLHEDQHFYCHPGVNPCRIVRARRSQRSPAARAGRLDAHHAARAPALRAQHAHRSRASSSRSRWPSASSCATRSASCWRRTSI